MKPTWLPAIASGENEDEDGLGNPARHQDRLRDQRPTDGEVG
ncbi:hypothetical protein [Actinoplanes utahensis]|nr:hypothetical protein [Actinoplanes utahensis]